MSPEKQRIAIAKVCGWKQNKAGWWKHPTAVEAFYPDFLNDLNAMHAAIRLKIAGNKDLEEHFVKELHAIQDSHADRDDIEPICLHEMVDILSHANWLSEAFLRTVGKWEDDS